MKMRLTFLGFLLGFSILGYWGHDLPTLNSPDAATAQDSSMADPSVAEVSRSETSLSDSVIKMAVSLAGRSRYMDAIALLQSVPPEDKNFAKARQLQNQSGAAILALGKAKLKQGKVSEGVVLLKSVPQTTQAHTEAAKLLGSQPRSN